MGLIVGRIIYGVFRGGGRRMGQSRSNTGKSSSVHCGRLVPGPEAQFRKTQQCSPWPVLRTDAGRGLQQQIGFARLLRPPAVLGTARKEPTVLGLVRPGPAMELPLMSTTISCLGCKGGACRKTRTKMAVHLHQIGSLTNRSLP